MGDFHINIKQVIYVSVTSFVPFEPNLFPYIVTDINERYFTARKLGTSKALTFSRKTGVCDDGRGRFYKVHLSSKEYWDRWKKK